MTEPAEREFEIVRTLSSPVALVFAALTEAEHLARWWGPEGFGVASASSETRPGGAFSIVMRAPDGSETPVDGTYVEFDPPRHLVATTMAVAPDGTELVASTVTIDLTPRARGPTCGSAPVAWRSSPTPRRCSAAWSSDGSRACDASTTT